MKKTQLNFRRSFILTLLLIPLSANLLASNLESNAGTTVTIKASSTLSGKTPTRIGISFGSNAYPGTNQWEFLRYSGVTAVRCGYISNQVYGYQGQYDPTPPHGDNVTDLVTFNQNRAIVRAMPENNPLIVWSKFNNAFANSESMGIRLDYILSKLLTSNIDVLFLMTRYVEIGYEPYSSDISKRWGDKWEEWLNRYAYAFYVAKNFGVCNFELYNEPHLPKTTFKASIPEYIERMQIGGDAIRCAIADVNRLYGKNLVANVVGPVCHGEQFYGGIDKELVDKFIGWGETTIDSLHTTYERTVDPSAFLVNSYCYHLYTNDTRTISKMVSNVDSNRVWINKTQRKYTNTPAVLPIWVSEWNIYTCDNFNPKKNPKTLDSPTNFSRFGASLGAYVETGLENLFVYQFGVKDTFTKNGLHYLSTLTTLNPIVNVGGLSRSAELLHLFAPAFANKEKFQKSTVSPTNDSLFVTTSKDDAAGYRYMWVSNISSKAIPLQIDLSQWNTPSINGRYIQEVSEKKFGELRSWDITTPSSPIVDIIPPYGTWLVSLYSGAALHQTDIKATEDATVTGGSSSSTNYGSSKTLDVSNHTIDPLNRNVTYMKFPLSSISTNEEIKRSILRVSSKKVTHLTTTPPNNGGLVVIHVYGLSSDAWSENSITWDTAPNLLKNSSVAAVVDIISDNFVTGVGTSAKFLGQITVSDDNLTTFNQTALDVTDFVSMQTDGFATIMLVREVRCDSDLLLPNRLDDTWRMRIQSKEDALGSAPTLSVFSQTKVSTDANISSVVTELSSLNPDKNDFRFSPNPIKGDLSISYTLNAQKNIEISVLDLTGSKVLQLFSQKQDAGNHQLKSDMSKLSKGNYLLEIKIDGSRFVKKMVKQ